MELGSSRWRQLVADGADAMHLTLPAKKIDQLALHAQELLRWNRKVNLTRIVDPAGIAVKHIIDSMAGIHAAPAGGEMLDLGSGPGYPGIVLKVMRPALGATLIDGNRKKVHFLKHVLRRLGLAGITAQHTRVEQLWESKEGFFDIVVSRAVGSLDHLLEAVQPLLSPDGRIVMYQGRVDRNALAKSLQSLNTTCVSDDPNYRHWHLAVYRYQLPSTGDRRHLVVAHKEAAPPTLYLGSLL